MKTQRQSAPTTWLDHAATQIVAHWSEIDAAAYQADQFEPSGHAADDTAVRMVQDIIADALETHGRPLPAKGAAEAAEWRRVALEVRRTLGMVMADLGTVCGVLEAACDAAQAGQYMTADSVARVRKMLAGVTRRMEAVHVDEPRGK